MSTATRRLHKLARLSAAERRWLVASVIALVGGHLVVRLVPYALWWRRLHHPSNLRSSNLRPSARPGPSIRPGSSARPRPSTRPRPRTANSSAFIAAQVARAARLIPRSTCLVQAVAVQLILRPFGHHTRIVIGVKQPLAAHAWVTDDDEDGDVILGRIPDLESYVPFPTEVLARSLK